MSPEDELKGALSFELGQIRKELAVLDRMAGPRKHLGPDEVKVRAAASSLHSIFNGIEKMLERPGTQLKPTLASHGYLPRAQRRKASIHSAPAGGGSGSGRSSALALISTRAPGTPRPDWLEVALWQTNSGRRAAAPTSRTLPANP